MGLVGVRNKKLLYHLNTLDNMESIVKYGLLSRKQVKSQNIKYNDIADAEIISKREELGLDGYVPFLFHSYSAFDVAVKSSKPDTKFVYVTIRR